MKRLFLFLITNIVVVGTISLVINYFGLNVFLDKNGINSTYLILFSLIWGMSGSFVSLFISKYLAKKYYNLSILDPNTQVAWEREVLKRVYDCSKKAGIYKMPEVGVYSSSEMNAFATGYSKNNSLIALSTGLLSNMNSDQVDGVIAHEVAHVANGDMVTMTLLQGVINSFVLFFSKSIAYLLSISSKDQKINYGIFYLVSFLLEAVLMGVGSLLVAAYSRSREFAADKDGAKIVGTNKMISALDRLRTNVVDPNSNDSFSSFKISNKESFLNLFSSHPSLSKRISRLKKIS